MENFISLNDAYWLALLSEICTLEALFLGELFSPCQEPKTTLAAIIIATNSGLTTSITIYQSTIC